MHHLCNMKGRYLFPIVLCLLCACSEVIDFPRPTHEPELVLFGTMDQEQISVFVTQTSGQQNSIFPEGIDDAKVEIESIDSIVFPIPNLENGNYSTDIPSETGKEYTLTVEKIGFPKILSTVVLPAPVNILSLEIQLLDSIALDTNSARFSYQFDIQLEEQNKEIEFYEVTSVFPAKLLFDSLLLDAEKEPTILPVQNANTIDVEYRGQFFVENIENNTISFVGEFDLTLGEYLKEVQITVKSSNLENYEHANSLFNLRRLDDGELITVNPIELYSNVENGQGFFSIFQIDTISQRIPR